MLTPLANPQPTKENPHIIPDYPYGFTLRCQMRVWVEHKDGKGYRYVTQTSNPRTGNINWNNPKASTYNPFPLIVGTNEEGHVKYTALHGYMEPGEFTDWLKQYGECLTEDQKKAIQYFMVRRQWLRENTHWTVHILQPGEKYDTEAQKEKQDKIMLASHLAAVEILSKENE